MSVSQLPSSTFATVAVLACLVGGCRKTAPPPTPVQLGETVMSRYLAAECAERTPLVLNSERNASAIREYYKSTNTCVRKHESMDLSTCTSPKNGGCYASVSWGKRKNVFGYEFDDASWFCLAQAEGTFVVDWRCSVGYNPIPLKTFRALHAEEQKSVFRLYGKISDYYNFEYRSAEKTHLAVELRDLDQENITGYLKKSVSEAPALFELLKDAKEHAVMVELMYNGGSGDAGVIEITRFLGDSWREHADEFLAR